LVGRTKCPIKRPRLSAAPLQLGKGRAVSATEVSSKKRGAAIKRGNHVAVSAGKTAKEGAAKGKGRKVHQKESDRVSRGQPRNRKGKKRT